jgi:hypothetical protein
MKQLKTFILGQVAKPVSKITPLDKKPILRTVQPKEHAKDYGEWLHYIYLELNRPSR